MGEKRVSGGDWAQLVSVVQKLEGGELSNRVGPGTETGDEKERRLT